MPAAPADLDRPLLPLVVQAVARLKGREARVLALRFCLVPGPRTLAGMASETGHTQQRLSQIEASAVRNCARIVDWPGGLNRLFAGIAFHAPVRLDRIAGEPWAEGLSRETLRYVVRAFGKPHVHIAERKTPREGEGPVLVPMAEMFWREGLSRASDVLTATIPGDAYDRVLETIWDPMATWPVHWRTALLCFLTDGLPPGDLATLRYRHGRRGFLNEHLQAGVEARDRRAWAAASAYSRAAGPRAPA